KFSLAFPETWRSEVRVWGHGCGRICRLRRRLLCNEAATACRNVFCDVFGDVVAKTDDTPDLSSGEGAFDVLDLRKRLGVINENFYPPFACAQRNPVMGTEILRTDPAQ